MDVWTDDWIGKKVIAELRNGKAYKAEIENIMSEWVHLTFIETNPVRTVLLPREAILTLVALSKPFSPGDSFGL